MIKKSKEPFNLKISLDSIHLTEKSRQLNTLVLGVKGTGKSNNVLPSFAKQDFTANDAGCTFIVGTKDMAYTLYALAKLSGKKKKDIIMLKPSANMGVISLFDMNEYDYDKVKELIDFKEAIRKKKVVIIDMEWEKYRNYAIKATAMLMIQLQMDMQDTKSTSKKPHNIYIDDAYLYLPFIELFLVASKSYNLSITLFMQSRRQFNQGGIDYSSLIDNNVRNLILMNGITYEDAEFYRKSLIFNKMFSKNDSNKMEAFLRYNKDIIEVKELSNGFLISYNFNAREMLNRKAGMIIADIIDKNTSRITKCCTLAVLSDKTMEDVRKLAIKTRKDMHKELGKPKIDKIEHISLQKLNEEEKCTVSDVDTMISSTERIEEMLTHDTKDKIESDLIIPDSDTDIIKKQKSDIIEDALDKDTSKFEEETLSDIEKELMQSDDCLSALEDDLEISGISDIDDFADIFENNDEGLSKELDITSKEDEINQMINDNLNDSNSIENKPSQGIRDSNEFETEFELDRPAVKRISRFSTFRPKTMNSASRDMLTNIFQKME
ncbi:hypothetical protein [[Clostridium] innocuum]|uniref:hypothetical protein n=1 Tax=Clostridium innocuum TaxID=1522 RepID=UPI000D6DA727|nr:hypothetical protein [[Clostridium] innocuum]MCR0315277.1 hypothetical protein [[Clostridium] innocuum]MCR0369701.1 hypothetical protein [[Clostridium] innocuum]MCR0559654.1 hypothetical protein [[Clostridium] innocuum]MCR0602652.1 hypothetical protein [[Clostridium] innocuum]PWJ12792.1 hypothetical protein ATF84_11342 [[Clostridium] innocuum]